MFYEEIQSELLNFVRRVHRKINYETDYRILAEKLGIKIKLAPILNPETKSRYGNSCAITPEHGPIMYLDPMELGTRRSFTVGHELGHFFAKAAGVEKQLLDWCETKEQAEYHLERMCDLVASELTMPEPLVTKVVDQFGLNALTINELAREAHVSRGASMRRLVRRQEDASLAGFIVSGSVVIDLSTYRCRLPFRNYQFLPASHEVFKAEEYENTKFLVENTDLHVAYIPDAGVRLGLVIATY